MRLRRPLAAGTLRSHAVITARAWSSALTIGPAGPPDLTRRHPAPSYVLPAAAPAGTGRELFALAALIYAVCVFVAGWRYARRPGPGRNDHGH